MGKKMKNRNKNYNNSNKTKQKTSEIFKLYRPEISQFLPCLIKILDKLRQLFILSNYIGEIDHFTLGLLKRSDT